MFTRIFRAILLALAVYVFVDGSPVWALWCPRLSSLIKSEVPRENLPKNVHPNLQTAIVEAFEAGPNHWIDVKNPPSEGKFFQRGLTGGNRSGADEALELLTGQPTSRETMAHALVDKTQKIFYREAWDYNNPKTQKLEDATRSAQVFAKPMAVRGRIDNYDNSYLVHSQPNEKVIAKDTVFAPLIYQLGFFMDEPSFSKYPTVYREAVLKLKDESSSTHFLEVVKWTAAYVTIYKSLAASGMVVRPNSAGGKFINALLVHFENAPDFPFNGKLLEKLDWVKAHKQWTLDLFDVVEKNWP